MFAALTGVSRASTRYLTGFKIGDFEIDNSNPFKKYEQLSSIDIVSDPLDKAALEMASGFEIYSEDKAQEEDVNRLREWAAEINLDAHVLTVARELLEKGTAVCLVEQQGDTISNLKMLPMRTVTLLTEQEQPGAYPTYTIWGEIDKVIINEGMNGADFKQEVFEISECLLYRYNHHPNFFKDARGRETYGIYGRSLIDKVEWRLELYFDLLESYRRFVQRYGYGRLFINSEVLAKLIEEGRYSEAKDVLEDLKAKQEEIEENQDIVGIGMSVEQLDTNTGLDVLGIKESLERDIAAYLFSSETASGKARGTTYASAYVVEQERIRILESYRRQIRRQLEFLIRRQAELWGIRGVEKLKIRFEKLDKERYEAKDIAALYQAGVLTTNEARKLAGFEPLPEFEDNYTGET